MRTLILLTFLVQCMVFLGCARQTGSQSAQHVTADEAKELFKQNPDVVILDVRTPEEFEKGHVQGARNLDFYASDFESRIAALDPSQTYLLYCASGNRSGKTATLMETKNFTRVYNSKAGFQELKSAGLPVQ